MKINFWNSDNMSQFWGYVKMLIQGIQPGLLMTISIIAVSLLLGIIIRSIKTANQQQNDDDDIEIRKY